MTILPTGILLLFAALMGYGIVRLARKKPSHTGNWSLDQATLPYADIDGDLAVVHNVRHCSYRTENDFTVSHYDTTYDLRQLARAYFIVAPFSSWRGVAHTMLSFEFEDGRSLALSVEIRKEKGYEFMAIRSGVLGLLRQFEIMYVLADERDVLKLRTNFRKERVFMYPLKVSKERIQETLKHVLERANSLYKQPEFYHTITNSCSSNLAAHLFELTGARIPWSLRLFPREMDRYLFDLGLIGTEHAPFDEVRTAHRINDLALTCADDPNFSLRIRGR